MLLQNGVASVWNIEDEDEGEERACFRGSSEQGKTVTLHEDGRWDNIDLDSWE